MSGRQRWAIGLGGLGVWLLAAPIASGQIQRDLAASAFAEARELSDADGAKLWRIGVHGPILFADPKSREVVANQADGEGFLKQEGALFVGRLPDSVGIANTATDWAGVHWTMVMWPLPEDAAPRKRLLAHEMFHRMQRELGMEARSPACAHLATEAGRVWLRLETRALVQALHGEGDARLDTVQDAVLFREQRRRLPGPVAVEERALELNEGLAEYTGFRLCGLEGFDLYEAVARELGQFEQRPSFSRSFAYVTGPAYFLLLDEFEPEWRILLDESFEPAAALLRAVGLSIEDCSPESAEERARAYGLEEVAGEERERAAETERKRRDYLSRFVDGPTLRLPFTDAGRFQFNPHDVFPMEDRGAVYTSLTMQDVWGRLIVQNGALLKPGASVTVALAGPGDRSLRTDGWTLELAAGWSLADSDRRPGDLVVKKN